MNRYATLPQRYWAYLPLAVKLLDRDLGASPGSGTPADISTDLTAVYTAAKA